MSSFLHSFALPVKTRCPAIPVAVRHKSEKRPSRFVKGPIPAEWLEQAARLPGKALHAALAICYLDGFSKTGTVRMRPKTRNDYGMDRFSCSRALEQLERAGLARVTRKPGSAPVVTILRAAEQGASIGGLETPGKS